MYYLRLCVVFFVHVSWRQLPRYGPSSHKRLKQQGRLSVNPPARRSGVKSSALVCLPFAILPNQTCLTAAYHATKNSSTTPQHSPEEALQTVAYASTTAWVSGRKETGLGLEGAIKLLRAPHINVPISVLSTTAPRTRQSSSRLALQLSHSQVPSFSTRNQVGSLEETQLPVQVCYPLGQEEEDQVNVCGSSPSSSTEVSRSSASLRLIEAW